MSESNPRSGVPEQFAATLEKCERRAASVVNANLEMLLDNAGPAFIEFAQKAQSDQVQAGFFSARGSLLARRGDVQQVFNRWFFRAFRELGLPLPKSPGPSGQLDRDAAEWSLVGDSEMDEMVATQNLIARAREKHFSELYALRQRLSLVNRGHLLDERRVPAGPYHLVHSFRHAIADLDLEIKARVILYALFDRFVLRDLKTLYDELNEILIADGILPHLKHVLNPHRTKAAAPEKVTGTPEDRETRQQDRAAEDAAHDLSQIGLGDALFASILQLMASKRVAAGSAADVGRGASSDHSRGDTNAASHAVLVSAIGDIQMSSESPYRRAFVDREAAAKLEADGSFVESAKSILTAQREQIFTQVNPQQLAQIDADTIDVVGLLFEYMLNDAALPNVAKALVSRLHTAYLKAALIDASLLDDASHPARQLLDLMVEAGGYYVDERDPNWGIFPALRETVERILASFTDNITIFQSLLEDLTAKVTAVQRKIVTLEQRSRQAAEGRERFQIAKQKVAEAIDQRTQPPWVLQEVKAFLSKAWSNQLVFVLLRDPDGERGEDWERALRVADDLAALCDRQAWALQRKDVEASLHGLHDEIELTLDTLGAHKPADWPPLAALLLRPEILFRRVMECPSEPLGAKARSGDREAHEPGADVAPADAQAQQFIEQLRTMPFGTWFEFDARDGGPRRRLKLSWHSPITETYMFVDRAGVKAEAFTMPELALQLAAGRATIMARPQQPFVERALNAIMQMLRGSSMPRQPMAAHEDPSGG